jgi:2-aminoethylphosphonate-pyruvate transaminase
MNHKFNGFGNWKDKILFTPGPITTSRSIKMAMMRDIGSRDSELRAIVADIRKRLLKIGGVSKNGYEAILLQGSGTFALEAVIASTVPPTGKVLFVVNGVYGRRMIEMAKTLKIEYCVSESQENALTNIEAVEKILQTDKKITNVAVVHCETTSGIMNPVKEIGEVVKKYDKIYFVDAVTTFGATPMNIKDFNIDYLVADSCKCFEGLPGFSIIIALRKELIKTKDYKRVYTYDLFSQWQEFEATGDFRFTPPTHILLAFQQALNELEEEGGVEERAIRYKANADLLIEGMHKFGFREYLFPGLRSSVIVSFLHHDHPNFSYDKFYLLLKERGQVIYRGSLSNYPGFRIATMGRIFPDDIKVLINAIEDVLIEMKVIDKNKLKNA